MRNAFATRLLTCTEYCFITLAPAYLPLRRQFRASIDADVSRRRCSAETPSSKTIDRPTVWQYAWMDLATGQDQPVRGVDHAKVSVVFLFVASLRVGPILYRFDSGHDHRQHARRGSKR